MTVVFVRLGVEKRGRVVVKRIEVPHMGFPRFGFDTFEVYPDMPCMKRVYRDKNATVHWSAIRNDERPWSRG